MPLTPRETLARLESLGHRPRKALGQNFLVDANIVRKSLILAEIGAENTIVEIGPGLGTLTEALLESGAQVYAVEFDQTLTRHLREEVAPRFPERFVLLEGDAIDHPRAGLPEEMAAAENWKVVANLPYAISTPWLEGLLAGPLPQKLVLMVQREAAERFTAQPGTKAMGAISVFLQGSFQRQPGHKVARGCFYPVPEVDSVLLCLARKPSPVRYGREAVRLIRQLFTQRRKQLAGQAREHPALMPWLEVLRQNDIPPTTRPEAVPLAMWERLAMMMGDGSLAD